ncbi:MAG: hypothetical protein AB1489_42630 [Acidobacteriota bacterium]
MVGLKDTSRDVENHQIELLRNAPLEKHVGLLCSLSELILQLSRQAIRAAYKDSDKITRYNAIVAHHYDQALADELKQHWRSGLQTDEIDEYTMSKPDILTAVIPVAEILDKIGIAYHIGGSFASSAYGVPRATADVDLMVDIRIEQVDLFVKALEAAYYINEKSVRDAIIRKSSFNIIHFDTMLKIDIFIPQDSVYDKQVMQRVLSIKLGYAGKEHIFYLKSPEDVVLTKLEWYRSGGEVSERQWSDVIGVLRVQIKTIDFDYLRRWAIQLKLVDLLEKAITESEQHS